MRVNPQINLARLLSLLGAICLVLSVSDATEWVSTDFQAGDFPLVQAGRCAEIVIAPEDFAVVTLVARNLAEDVERVTGCKPALRTNIVANATSAVFIGTLGRSALIDGLVKKNKINVATLIGQWESFLIVTVTNPVPGVEQALVIVGSDRRGTAFGVYELSQAMGVSPWHWWADVNPERKSAVYVKAGARKFGPPSVRYRGIFINDEDWGLQPWAAQTFEPETGDIGPKTYTRMFELLLRLKANTLWPAMHACTKPFHQNPEHARLADAYAIVMGSSHAEPMLRNNVGEWTEKPEQFNYAQNRAGVLKYWEERIRTNGRYENIYTLGMRGIHDSAMQGPRSTPERLRLLDQIIADQRALLGTHVNPKVEEVPQIFCAYKEVLDLYRAGLKVPDDVTILWPDDNFGYIRHYARDTERQHPGGFGIYYHLSYLGRPLAYLWLNTTPPALIWSEMSKAYAFGADRVWVVNVGDLKPAEIGTEFFLQMAWDINRWRADNLPEFLKTWAAREFGSQKAQKIATVMAEYYRLNFQRKPEHLQWWLPGQPVVASPFNETECNERLAAFQQLRAQVESLRGQLADHQRDAFFELVEYPVLGSALANERYFHGEHAARTAATEALALAEDSDQQLKALPRHFNENIAGGKWRGFMRLEPADREWRSMRIESWKKPQFEPRPNNAGTNQFISKAAPADFSGFEERAGIVSIEAENFSKRVAGNGAEWTVIPGLGRSGDAVTLLPVTRNREVAATPQLEYPVHFATAGTHRVQLHLLPTHPISGATLRLAVGLDDEPLQLVALAVKDGGPDWAQGVLNNVRVAETKLLVKAPGVYTLRIFGPDPGVVLDKIVIDCGGQQESYLGPGETRK
jgi:hypothetical protein